LSYLIQGGPVSQKITQDSAEPLLWWTAGSICLQTGGGVMSPKGSADGGT